jgi:hypothetical protein
MSGGTESFNEVAEYTTDPSSLGYQFLPLATGNTAPTIDLTEFSYLLGTYKVAVKVDGGYLANVGVVTLLSGVTLVLDWTSTSANPTVTQETDSGQVQLVRSYTGTAPGSSILDGVYKDSEIIGFWLTNTQTGIQYAVYDTTFTLNLSKTVPTMDAAHLKNIPVGEYTALIQYKQTAASAAVSYIVNDTDPDVQPVTVTVTKNTRTILYHTIPNKYWDMVNASGTDGTNPNGRLEITNSASNTNYGIVLIEIWTPAKAGNMGTSSMTGRTKLTEFSGLLSYQGVHTFTLPSGGYSIRLRRTYTNNWYGYGLNTWKTVTVSPGRTTAIYWAATGTQLRP